jgi:SOS-response transcriptional repressor LexA
MAGNTVAQRPVKKLEPKRIPSNSCIRNQVRSWGHEDGTIPRRRNGAGRPRGIETRVVRLPVPLADLARRLADSGIRAGDVNAFLDVEPRLHQTVPLVGATASCGFPSPADDYLDRPLHFNELLIENPAATFAVRASGLSMIGAGIFLNDIYVVNRAATLPTRTSSSP